MIPNGYQLLFYKSLLYNWRIGAALSLSSAYLQCIECIFLHFNGMLIWSNFPYFIKLSVSSVSIFEFNPFRLGGTHGTS